MIKSFGLIHRFSFLTKAIPIRMSQSRFGHGFSSDSEEPRLKELLDYLEKLKNYEKLGVPKGAGTDSDDGFDLGRMKRLLERLGNPLSKYKVVHIAGTKGKGSTAAFLSNILRAEGYSVGCYTSPHLLTIRERFSFSRKGEPVSAETLNNLFHRVRKIIDQSIDLEKGSLTHFEILTALGFSLFAQEKVDIAVVEAGLGGARDATNVICSEGLAVSVITTIGEEHLAALGGSLESIAIAKSGIIKRSRPLVMGGPFEPHIEWIICQKAASMYSPVVSASDPGVRSIIKGFYGKKDKPYQLVDLLIQVEKDFHLSIELFDVRLHMLGHHQLQNAATATCASLCLRNLGWKISDDSIRTGLENTYLLGRCQFLTREEAEVIGLFGVSILIDGAHTEAAAKALADTIIITHPNEPVALVVAMASDKDQLSFARQLLSGRRPEVVVLTEVSIAGGKSRMTPASLLKNVWIQAAHELGNEVLDVALVGQEKDVDASKQRPILIIDNETAQILDSVKLAYRLLRSRTEEQSGVVVVTGSLHIASSVLALLNR